MVTAVAPGHPPPLTVTAPAVPTTPELGSAARTKSGWTVTVNGLGELGEVGDLGVDAGSEHAVLPREGGGDRQRADGDAVGRRDDRSRDRTELEGRTVDHEDADLRAFREVGHLGGHREGDVVALNGCRGIDHDLDREQPGRGDLTAMRGRAEQAGHQQDGRDDEHGSFHGVHPVKVGGSGWGGAGGWGAAVIVKGTGS